MTRILALLALAVPGGAAAYCTNDYDPWSEVACNDPDDGLPTLDPVTCDGLLFVNPLTTDMDYSLCQSLLGFELNPQ